MAPREFESIEEIRLVFSGIFDRLSKVEPEERAAVIWAINSDWCMGCGLIPVECESDPDECLEDDPETCCKSELREVTIGQCPKCEMLIWSTLRVPPTPEEE